MKVLALLVALSACAARPAEVRVGFDATGETSLRVRGLADRTTHRRVTADDPVRVASISKLVIALGVLRLVEAGKLDACYNWGAGCSDAAVARAVVLHRANGEVARDDLHGRRPECPVVATAGCDLAAYRPGENGAIFSPQGGLRISMRGLGRIGRMLLKQGDGFLKPESIATIEATEWTFDGTNGDTSQGLYCRYGLATQTLPTARAGCEDDLFADGGTWVGHAGEAYALRSGLWIDRRVGRGVAFFTSAVRDGSKGRSRFSAEEERLVRLKR